MKSSKDSHFGLSQAAQERTFREAGRSNTAAAFTSRSMSTEVSAVAPTQHEISVRAYECWKERGCPLGSSDTDWLKAENELKMASKTTVLSRSAAASR